MLNQAKQGAESGDDTPTPVAGQSSQNNMSPVAEAGAEKAPTNAQKPETSNKPTNTTQKPAEQSPKAPKQQSKPVTPPKDSSPAETRTTPVGVNEDTLEHIIKTLDVYRDIISKKANNTEHLTMLAGVLGLGGIQELKNEPKTIMTVLGTQKELFTLFDTLTEVRELPETEQIFELLEYDETLLGNIYNILSGLFPDVPNIKNSNKIETVRAIHPLINKLGEPEDELFKDLVKLLEVVHRTQQ